MTPTRRELQVLAMSCLMPGKIVAYRLGIGHNTVKGHLTMVNRKLGVGSRTEAAIALGWLKVPEELLP